MPCFICTKCGCMENTAVSKYWKRRSEGRELVCSACDEEIGKWHGRFPKKHWSEYGTKEQLIAWDEEGKGNCVNAKEYFALMESKGLE